MLGKSLIQIGLISFSLLAASCAQEPVQRITVAKKNGAGYDGKNNQGQSENLEEGKTPGSSDGEKEPEIPKPTETTQTDPTTKPDPVKEPVVVPTPMVPEKPAMVDAPPSTHMDAEFISSFIDEIAGKKGAGRGTGSPENKAVAQKIADEFKALGFKAGGDNGSYFQAFSAKGRATQNIIGVLPGETDEYIVIGAHMDHLGVVNGQTMYGADDNASGTTGLMASARAFAKNNVKLKRSIMFIAFSGEEMGLLGSIHFVKNPTIPIKNVKFMVNMDMIGRYNKEMEVLGIEKSIEGNSITRELVSKTAIKPKYLAEVSAGGSDHMPFKEIGIPTATFHTGLHAEYHKTGDTTEKINKDVLKTIAGIAADLTHRLAKIDAITSSKYALVPIEVDGYADGVHSSAGCQPGLVTFEELQSNLSSLKSAQ